MHSQFTVPFFLSSFEIKVHNIHEVNSCAYETMNSPEKIVNLNAFQTLWTPFTRIFQALCVSHYSIFRPNLQENRYKSYLIRAYFLFVFAVHISLVSTSTINGLRCDKNATEQIFSKHKESSLMYYINCFTILGSFTTHLTSHLETLLHGKREADIYKKLQLIDHIFATKLNYMIDYQMKRAKYIKQIGSVFVLTIILAGASSFTSLPDMYHDKYFMQPILIFAVIVNRGRWCYIAFFLNAIADTLEDLQVLLAEQQIQSRKQNDESSESNFVREKIQYFREIYSNVWLVISYMSDCFGLSLITFLLEFTFEIISACYWIYINFSFYGSSDLNIRKSVLFVDYFTFSLFMFHSNDASYDLFSDIMLYSSSIAIVFWYFCMLSEKCQNMVTIRMQFDFTFGILKSSIFIREKQ